MQNERHFSPTSAKLMCHIDGGLAFFSTANSMPASDLSPSISGNMADQSSSILHYIYIFLHVTIILNLDGLVSGRVVIVWVHYRVRMVSVASRKTHPPTRTLSAVNLPTPVTQLLFSKPSPSFLHAGTGIYCAIKTVFPCLIPLCTFECNASACAGIRKVYFIQYFLTSLKPRGDSWKWTEQWILWCNADCKVWHHT